MAIRQALLVGINSYFSAPLSGCVNDVTDMAEYLVSAHGFKKGDIRLLVDERATKEAIMDRLGWLLNGLAAGDKVVFHFSGHGTQLPTRNNQGEVDGLDEAICSVTFNWDDLDNTAIRDKEFARMFRSIPSGVNFTFISDSCNSGGLTRFLLHPSNPHRRIPRSMPVPADIDWRRRAAISKGLRPLGLERAMGASNLVFVSGCRSHETSADAWFDDRPNGALTYHLLASLKANPATSIRTVVNVTQRALTAEDFTQHPQLKGSLKLRRLAFLGGT